MPWQLSGNGRSDWSTKLIRGLKAEAAAGFQSRRERCREPTPVTPQYAAFSTYKAARAHYASRWRGGAVAVWPLGAVAQQASQGYVRRRFSTPLGRVSPGLNEAGYVEGQNVAVEYRWAENQLNRLPALAADLVRRQVALGT